MSGNWPTQPALAATLETRAWCLRRKDRTGQPPSNDDVITHVHKHFPDLSSREVGYVVTYAQPIAAKWPSNG